MWRSLNHSLYMQEIIDYTGILFGEVVNLLATSDNAPTMVQSGPQEFSLAWNSTDSPPKIIIEKSKTTNFLVGGAIGPPGPKSDIISRKEFPELSYGSPILVNHKGKTLLVWSSWYPNHHIYISPLSSFQ